MVGELIKNILEEEGEYKPVDGPEIGSLILIDRGQFYMICMTIPFTTRQCLLMKYSLLGHWLTSSTAEVLLYSLTKAMCFFPFLKELTLSHHFVLKSPMQALLTTPLVLKVVRYFIRNECFSEPQSVFW